MSLSQKASPGIHSEGVGEDAGERAGDPAGKAMMTICEAQQATSKRCKQRGEAQMNNKACTMGEAMQQAPLHQAGVPLRKRALHSHGAYGDPDPCNNSRDFARGRAQTRWHEQQAM